MGRHGDAVMAKSLLHRLAITGLLLAAAAQLAAQQRLRQPHHHRVQTTYHRAAKPEGPKRDLGLGICPTDKTVCQACQTLSTDGVGCSYTLTWRVGGAPRAAGCAASGPVRQAVSKL